MVGSLQDRPSYFGLQGSGRIQSDSLKAATDKSSNSASVPEENKSSNSAPVPEKSEIAEKPAHKNSVPDAASISAFMTQVADLVKLVDSRDIMELELKQLDCELLIRKKEALPQPPAAPVMMQSPPPQFQMPSPHQDIPSPPSPPPVSAPAPPTPAKPTKSSSSHPPLKCPMAGTFYRCPAPDTPPFVKVGDKIQKGQVVCIIEAMKLMNEIESDQSGTVVEILVDDGKPVSVDTPLFAIEP